MNPKERKKMASDFLSMSDSLLFQKNEVGGFLPKAKILLFSRYKSK